MRQTEMLSRVMRLKKGLCFDISDADMREAAEGSFSSAFDGPARDSDVKQYVQTIEKNWDINVLQDPMSGNWTIRKN